MDYSSDSGSILMDMNTYHRYWKEFLADSFSVRVIQKNEVEAVRDEIARRFGNDRQLFVLPAREFKGEIRKIIDQGFAVNHAINIITMIIACFGIIVTLLASVLERTREIGILRSIGMLRSQVSRVVVIESMLLGIIGGALGAGAGVIVGWMSLEGFLKGDYGASMQYHVHYCFDSSGRSCSRPCSRPWPVFTRPSGRQRPISWRRCRMNSFPLRIAECRLRNYPLPGGSEEPR